MPSPAYEKNNPLTQVIRRAQEINAAAGMPAGRSLSDQPNTVGPGTSVRSAAMNNPPPLSEAEVAARDAAARQLGIIPPDDEAGPYGSLAAAQEAGMPVEQERRSSAGEGTLAHEQQALRGAGMSSRQTAREFLASRGTDVVTPIVKLPDFRKIEGFDFFRNVLYIDGLEFEIPAEDVLAMKRYAVDIALDHVVKQLAEALIVFGVPPALAQATADSVKESAANAQATTEGSGTTADAGTERLLEGHHETASGAPSDGVSRSD